MPRPGCHPRTSFSLVSALALLLPPLAAPLPSLAQDSSGPAITVSDRAALEAALTRARPGTVIRLQPGHYGRGLDTRGLRGTAEQPIVIEGPELAPAPTAVFGGGPSGMHLSGCSHLVLRRLRIAECSVNGINIDDATQPGGSQHITLEDIHVEDIGPRGNHDGIKLSGLDGFTLRRCRVTGWGGQAVDMVGCRNGLLEDCVFLGKAGFEQNTGVQMKGGSERVTVRDCAFTGPMQRGVNLGGSTGRPYFRPADATWEGRQLLVERCQFTGGMAGVSFVGSEDCTVRHCTFHDQEAWVLRILQENREPGMIPCRNNRFEDNRIAIRQGKLRAWVNVGEAVEAATFQFARNHWYQAAPGRPAHQELPAPEKDGVYGQAP